MTNIYSIKGKVKGEAKLPKVFTSPYRPDLIQRSVVAEQAFTRQPQGVDPGAGFRTSAGYFGSRKRSYRQSINKAMARLPREKRGGGGLGKVRRVPQSVGGHRAHPPQCKDYSKKINNKEWKNALDSAIAATANKKLVEERGHNLGEIKDLPIIIEDAVQEVKKASEAVKILKELGLAEELDRCRQRGVGMLLVVGEDKGVMNALNNIKGLEVATINDLDVDTLAPGTHAGRLTIWTESAIKKLD
ncbi:MAG: 50S ribosomal protein L4 [Candidatus Altiarchaeota archaeon]